VTAIFSIFPRVSARRILAIGVAVAAMFAATLARAHGS
jgi:hypothetical protein